jgi:hypothetical protein
MGLIRTPIYRTAAAGRLAKAQPDPTTAVKLPDIGTVDVSTDRVSLRPEQMETLFTAQPSDTDMARMSEAVADAQESVRSRAAAGAGGQPQEPARESAPDTPLTKLVKYVPIEFVSGFVGVLLLVAGLSESEKWDHRLIVSTYILFAVFTPIVFFLLSRGNRDEDRPMWFFYPLSLLAFLGWGVGSSQDLRDVLSISSVQSESIVGLAAVGIPALDWLLTKALLPGEAATQPAPAGPAPQPGRAG